MTISMEVIQMEEEYYLFKTMIDHMERDERKGGGDGARNQSWMSVDERKIIEKWKSFGKVGKQIS